MSRSRPYRYTDVKRINADSVLAGRDGQAAVLGVDVGKSTLALVLWWKLEDFESPWLAQNPGEIGLVVQLVKRLAQGRSFAVAVESSGTYGDALRQALSDAKIEVKRVSSKASHDYAEIFDGVPSQHDGKDAAVIAELCGTGKATLWPWREDQAWEQEMQQRLEEFETLREMAQIRYGQLEARLARHWPESLAILRPSSMALVRALEYYGGPGALAQDKQAADRLQKWGGWHLARPKIQALVESAGRTAGVRQTEWDRRSLKRLSRNIRRLKGRMRRHRRRVLELSRGKQKIQAMGQVVGVMTACVLWVCLGDPADYGCAAAYRKAMGLNLAERSSGQYQGQLKISKRGERMTRRWMYLAALREVRGSERVRGWYGRKRLRMAGAWHGSAGRKPRPGVGAVVAVMRKLALAIHAVSTQGSAYDARRLFKTAQKKVATAKTP